MNKKKNTKQQLPNLPEEIIHEIFCKLPAKSLCRFRCLSKPWNIQINSPNFFHACSNNNLTFVLRHGDEKLSSLEYDDSSASLSRSYHGERIKQSRHPFSFSDTISFKIVGSCNGLVCISYYYILRSGSLHCVWNPYTEEYKIIPKSTMNGVYGRYESLSDVYRRAYGFGYDLKTNDFKFVDIMGSISVCCISVVDVHSLKSNTWKRLTIPYELCTGATPGVFFNGALHWFAKTNLERNQYSSYRVVLIAFNVGEGFVVQEIPLPEGLDVDKFRDDKYVDVLGGCLCLLGSSKADDFEVWKMTDTGLRESWVKLYNISRLLNVKSFQCSRRIKCLNDDQILILLDIPGGGNDTLVLYDLKDGRSRVMKLEKDVLKLSGPLYLETYYVKSLFSLNSGTYVGDKVKDNIDVWNELCRIRPRGARTKQR